MSQELQSAAPRHRRKLLILENDKALRRELEQIFSDLEVTSTETSEQALVLVRRLEPGAVTTDPQSITRHQDHRNDRARCPRAVRRGGRTRRGGFLSQAARWRRAVHRRAACVS